MNKKLTRNTIDGKIGGVCTGLSNYFDIDASLIRIIFLLGALFGGFFILLYLIMWIVVPKN